MRDDDVMSFVVIAHYRANAGAEDAVADALRHMIEPTRAEPGNRRYEVYRSPEDPAVFALCEEYDDAEAFAAHVRSAHFVRWLKDGVLPLLSSRQRYDLVPL